MKSLFLLSVTILVSLTYCFGEEIGNCWPLLLTVFCQRFDEQCITSKQCNSDQVCCKYECGTNCLAKDLVGRRPGFQGRKQCWELKQMACKRFDEKCKTNDECKANEICCKHECGTQCRNIELIGKNEKKRSLKPSSKTGCPPVDTDLNCFWFNKTCDKDSDCKEKNICCADNCGTFCHKSTVE